MGRRMLEILIKLKGFARANSNLSSADHFMITEAYLLRLGREPQTQSQAFDQYFNRSCDVATNEKIGNNPVCCTNAAFYYGLSMLHRRIAFVCVFLHNFARGETEWTIIWLSEEKKCKQTRITFWKWRQVVCRFCLQFVDGAGRGGKIA